MYCRPLINNKRQCPVPSSPSTVKLLIYCIVFMHFGSPFFCIYVIKLSTVHKQHYNCPLPSWDKQISMELVLLVRILYLSRLRTGRTPDSLVPFCSPNIHYKLSPLSTRFKYFLYVHYTVLFKWLYLKNFLCSWPFALQTAFFFVEIPSSQASNLWHWPLFPFTFSL